MYFNSLPNDKILDWSKFKAFADDKINETKELTFVLEREESIVERGENAGHQHFILFPQCFQKVSFLSGLSNEGLIPNPVLCAVILILLHYY